MPTLEQITGTGLFSVGSDNTFQETMVSLGDVLLAEEFAEAINSGRLSVRDAYVNFWSYVEDKELWDLRYLSDDECRALLPDWKPILLHLAGMLEDNRAVEFVKVIGENYFKVERIAKGHLYNPCLADYFITVRLADQSEFVKNRLGRGIKIEASFKDQSHRIISISRENPQDLGNPDKLFDVETSGSKLSIFPDILAYRTTFDVEYLNLKVEPILAILHRYDPDIISVFDLDNIMKGRPTVYQVLRDIKEGFGLGCEFPFGVILMTLHNSLKPQGYIAPERLAA